MIVEVNYIYCALHFYSNNSANVTGVTSLSPKVWRPFIFMLIPYCFDYCGFIIYFEIRKCDALRFVLFQYCFGYLVFFAVQFDLLVCFHAVALISNVAMNIQVRKFFERVVFFEYISRNDIAGSSIFNLLKNLSTVFIMDILIYIPTNRIQEFLYSISLPTLVIFYFFITAILICKKGNPKECLNYHKTALISHASKVMLKILQARLQQYMNHDLPDVQFGFRKG